MTKTFFDELVSKYENETDFFVFDATNIDGIYKYLKTVRRTKERGHLV